MHEAEKVKTDPKFNPKTDSQTKASVNRGGFRTPATFKMEHFLIIVNSWKPLTITTKSSILDVAAVLNPPLVKTKEWYNQSCPFVAIS